MAKRRGEKNTAGGFKDDWCTPNTILDPVRAVLGRIELDPASNPDSIVGADVAIVPPFYRDGPCPCAGCGGKERADGEVCARCNGFGSREPPLRGLDDASLHAGGILLGDGLTLSWKGAATVYVNPPYGRGENRRWAERIHRGARTEVGQLIALVPASTGARWFGNYTIADAICFWAGRVKFEGAPDPADFESAIAYWGTAEGADRFYHTFKPLGWVVTRHGHPPSAPEGLTLYDDGRTV